MWQHQSVPRGMMTSARRHHDVTWGSALLTSAVALVSKWFATTPFHPLPPFEKKVSDLKLQTYTVQNSLSIASTDRQVTHVPFLRVSISPFLCDLQWIQMEDVQLQTHHQVNPSRIVFSLQSTAASNGMYSKNVEIRPRTNQLNLNGLIFVTAGSSSKRGMPLLQK